MKAEAPIPSPNCDRQTDSTSAHRPQCLPKTRSSLTSRLEIAGISARHDPRGTPLATAVFNFVIFDVDGTLVDSVDLHARAWQETFREFGKDFTFEEVRSQIGKGGDQLLPVFFDRAELEKIEKTISAHRTELFRKKYLPEVRGFPAVRVLFERLLADGKTVALASSAIGEELKTYKERTDITDLIETETSKDDAEKSKPYPDIFQAALERLGGPPFEETVVIGDTPYDIEAASRAGLRTIAVRCGGFPEESLQGAIAIFDDPAHLLASYDEWVRDAR